MFLKSDLTSVTNKHMATYLPLIRHNISLLNIQKINTKFNKINGINLANIPIGNNK